MSLTLQRYFDTYKFGVRNAVSLDTSGTVNNSYSLLILYIHILADKKKT